MPRSISTYALEDNNMKGKEIKPKTRINVSINRKVAFLFTERKCSSMKGTAATGKILEQIERLKKIEERAGRLSNKIIEISNNSKVKESLCPDTEYSNSEAGKNKRITERSLTLSIESFCDFSRLYIKKIMAKSHITKNSFKSLTSSAIKNGTVM
jgi:hypothetical protein